MTQFSHFKSKMDCHESKLASCMCRTFLPKATESNFLSSSLRMSLTETSQNCPSGATATIGWPFVNPSVTLSTSSTAKTACRNTGLVLLLLLFSKLTGVVW